jgi:hypothetical protein
MWALGLPCCGEARLAECEDAIGRAHDEDEACVLALVCVLILAAVVTNLSRLGVCLVLLVVLSLYELTVFDRTPGHQPGSEPVPASLPVSNLARQLGTHMVCCR